MKPKSISFNLFGRTFRIEFIKAPKKDELDEHMQVHLENMENKDHYSDEYLWFYKKPYIEKETVKGIMFTIKMFWLHYGIAIRVVKQPVKKTVKQP